jgi:hypothetical protein
VLMDKSAAQLADLLDGMRDFPHNTAGMSMLDEATIAFRDLSPAVREAQGAFGEARYRHARSYRGGPVGYSDESWAAALTAAGRLADMLRPLGDTRISRCKRQAGWGVCNLPLDPDGGCRSSLGHVDAEEHTLG